MGYLLGRRNGGGCCNHRSLKGGIRFDRIRICQRWWLVNLPSPGLVQGLLKSVVSLDKAFLNMHFRGEYARGGGVGWPAMSKDIPLHRSVMKEIFSSRKGPTNHPSPPQKTEPTMKLIPPILLGYSSTQLVDFWDCHPNTLVWGGSKKIWVHPGKMKGWNPKLEMDGRWLAGSQLGDC